MNFMGKIVSKTTLLVIAAGAVLACAVFMFGGITLYMSTSNQNKTYTGTVEATVVDYEVHQEEFETTDSNNNPITKVEDVYSPIFRYTVDGQEYETVSESGSNTETYEVNSQVTIKYLPDDPTMFYIEGDSTRTFLPYVLCAAGLVCLFIAVKTGLTAIRH